MFNRNKSGFSTGISFKRMLHVYFTILIFVATTHGFPHNEIEDTEFQNSDPGNHSINNDDLVSIEQMLSRLAEITSSNVTVEEIKDVILNSPLGTDDTLEVEPRFIKHAAIASAVAIAAKAIIAHTSFSTFLSFVPFFKVRKVLTVAPDATAVIVPGVGRRTHGRLLFFNVDHGVQIVGEIRGLTPGRHGIHVHRFSDIGRLCSSAGPHFNPTNSNHGGPFNSVRHIGDLGNIIAGTDGVSQVDIFDRLISLDTKSANYIGNRAIVIHADADDLGLRVDRNPNSLNSGNSGHRVGCGLIVKEFTRHV